MEKRCGGFDTQKGICKNTAKFPRKSPFCSNCAGKSFEYQMARLFEIQGCEVMRNLKLCSNQNDFFAIHKQGFMKSGILVECKWKFNEKDTVKADDVRIFNSAWAAFNQDGKYGIAHQAYLITNGRFSAEAIEMGKTHKLELWTEKDLIGNLIDFRPYLKTVINQYETSSLPGHYIELNSVSGSTLQEAVQEMLFESEENAVVVLGDYGCGKTSLCLKLCHDYAKKIIEGKNAPLPIYIQLRKYNKAIDIEGLITHILVNECKIQNANMTTFREFLQYSNAILIFDGFDEIAKRVDYGVKYEVFNEICKFVTDRTKVIVTCRPNFFNQRQDFEKIFKASPLSLEPNVTNVEFSEVEVDDLNVEQINDYIKTYENDLIQKGFDINQFMKILTEVHDLWDLAKRPVLLNIIIATVPSLNKDKRKIINAATLYEEYTDKWLKREDSKGKTLINSERKMIFMRELSKEMFMRSELSIHYNDLPNVIKKYIPSIDLGIEYLSHDIKSCSFLNTEGNGYFKFIHKSFMEYFVAYQLLVELREVQKEKTIKKIKKVNGEILGGFLISLEVGLFIKDFLDLGTFRVIDIIMNLEDFKELNITAKKNMLSILGKIDFSKVAQKQVAISAKAEKERTTFIDYLNTVEDLEGADLSNSIIENVIIKNKSFDSVSFYNTKINNVKFVNCSFINSIFRKSEMNKVTIDQLDIEGSDLSNSILRNCSFKGTNFSYCKFNNAKFNNCNFYSADLTEISHNKDTELVACKNIETAVGIPYSF